MRKHNLKVQAQAVVVAKQCQYLAAGECRRTTMNLLGLSKQYCAICRPLAQATSSIESVLAPALFQYMQDRVQRNLDFILIGEFGRYAVNPYVGTVQYQRFTSFDLDMYDQYDHLKVMQGIRDPEFLKLKTYAGYSVDPKHFQCKTHILMRAVSDVDWDIMTAFADKHHINLVVHDRMGQANVSNFTEGCSVYHSGMNSMSGAIQGSIDNSEEVACVNKHQLTTFKVSLRKPVFSNMYGGMASWFTKRFVATKYICYDESYITTTDNLIKWSAFSLNGATTPKTDAILHQIQRLSKLLRQEVKDLTRKNPFFDDLLRLNKMDYLDQQEHLRGLVLYHVQFDIAQTLAITDYLKKQDVSMLDLFISRENDLGEIQKEVIPVAPHTNFKPVPEQRKGASHEIISVGVDRNSHLTLYEELGPSVNGCTTVVPATECEAQVLSSLLGRQQAASLNVDDEINEVLGSSGNAHFKKHIQAFIQEMKDKCPYNPWPMEEAIASLPSDKRPRYIQAQKNIEVKQMLKTPDLISTIRKSFLKQERLYTKAGEAEEKCFRLIQGVSNEATLVLLTHMLPFANQLSKLHQTEGPLSPFCYTSGMDAVQIGNEVDLAIGRCEDSYWVIENDFTLFDASQGKWCHDLEVELLNQCASEDPLTIAAVNVLERQEKTVGYISENKSKLCIKYVTPYTRKSGDANTSVGNSTINIAATSYVYKQVGIMDDVELSLVMGDDGLTIVSGEFPIMEGYNEEESIDAMQQMITVRYAKLGFKAKVKITKHIAKAEFCSAIFAPIDLGGGETSLCLIAKLGRVALKFNKVKTSSLVSKGKRMPTVDYVEQNLVGLQNTLQFYPGLSNFQTILKSAIKRKVQGVSIAYNLHNRLPSKLVRPAFNLWDEYLEIRYGMIASEMFTDVNLTTRGSGNGNVVIPWFDAVAAADF